MTKMYGFEITQERLIKKLENNIFKCFEKISDEDYIFKGYSQPLLASIKNNWELVFSPFKYMGSYDYKGQDIITLHSTYGKFNTYKKLIIFGVPFMVETEMTDEDAIMSAETSRKFVEWLIDAF